MSEQYSLARRLEEHRPRLRAVAYRMLGWVSEADDAVQEAWLRLSGSEPAFVAGPLSRGMAVGRRQRRHPEGTIERPQVVCVSNNPYHIATPRCLGRCFALDRGVLGVIVLKRSPGAAPEPLSRLVRDATKRVRRRAASM